MMYNYPYNLNITYNDCIKIGDKIFFSCNTFNGLFYQELQTGKIVHCGIFKNEALAKPNLHQKIFFYNNKLYFTPYYATNLGIYDLKNKSFECIKLSKWKGTRANDSYLYKNKLWIFYASKRHSAVYIDLDNNSVVNLPPYVNIFNDNFEFAENIFFSTWAFNNEFAWGPVWNSNKILKINVDCCDYEVLDTLPIDFHLKGIASIDDVHCAVLLQNDDIYIANVFSGKSTKLISNSDNHYVDIYNNSNYVFMLPSIGNSIDVVDFESQSVIPLFELPADFEFNSDVRKAWRSFFHMRNINDTILIMPYKAKSKIILNIKQTSIQYSELSFERDDIESLWGAQYKPRFIETATVKPYVNESKFLTLDDYMTLIADKKFK